MQLDHLFEELRFRTRDILDRLAGHRIGREADEVAGMSRLERDADFAIGLETANAWTVAGPRIDNDKRSLRRVHLHALGRDDLDQTIVHRPVEFTTVDDDFDLVIENMRNGLGGMLLIRIAALPHGVPEQRVRCAASTMYSVTAPNPFTVPSDKGSPGFLVFAIVCHLHLQRSTVISHSANSAPEDFNR